MGVTNHLLTGMILQVGREWGINCCIMKRYYSKLTPPKMPAQTGNWGLNQGFINHDDLFNMAFLIPLILVSLMYHLISYPSKCGQGHMFIILKKTNSHGLLGPILYTLHHQRMTLPSLGFSGLPRAPLPSLSHSLKLNSKSIWKWMVGIRLFPFGAFRPIFRCELLISGSVGTVNSIMGFSESSSVSIIIGFPDCLGDASCWDL